MTVTSFGFLCLIAAGAVLYYLLPKAWQWVELLILSLLFYYFAAEPYTIIYLAASAFSAYISTNFMASEKGKTERGKKLAALLGVLAVSLNIVLWFVLKGNAFWLSVNWKLRIVFPSLEEASPLSFAAPLGMGYYTLQVIGYILDCYWGNITPQKNPLKLFLFVCFFPQMTTGPISRYGQLTALYEKHQFSYQNFCFGAQRILWGFFKKLILAERAGIIVDGIWNNPDSYTGYYRWIALLLFPVQMYADFSGCMDIAIGAAEIFGIRLPENFNTPFFSKTVQEFWQRWHITLGTWAKDYVLYPLLKSRVMIKISKRLKRKFGKKAGKFVTTAIGMLFLWTVMGIWHGAIKYVIGVSLWYWGLLMLGELCGPWLHKLAGFLHIPTESFSWHLFQSIRTYFIYAVGAVFFRSTSVQTGLHFMAGLLEIFDQDKRNPWIFFDGSILNLGISHQDINFMIFAVLLLLLAGILRERHGYARIWISKQWVVFRWLVWLGLFVLILIYGKYGPGYSAAEFIYQGF